MADGIKVYQSGAWHDIVSPKIYVGGWKTPDAVSVYQSGAWHLVWPTGPAVTLSYVNNVTSRSGTCQSNIKLGSDGDCYKSDNVGGYGTKFETWLDSGLNSEVWVELIISTGTLQTNNFPTAPTRKLMTADGEVGTTEFVVDTQIATGEFNFYDAATGGTLLHAGTWRCKAERF